MTNDARIVKAPDGREFVVEMWAPQVSEAGGLSDGLLLLGWSLIKPGWRINVKDFPVKGSKALYRERVRAEADAERRVQEIAESLQRDGWPPPAQRAARPSRAW